MPSALKEYIVHPFNLFEIQACPKGVRLEIQIITSSQKDLRITLPNSAQALQDFANLIFEVM